MKDHDRNKESYLKYWDINKLHGSAMLEKLPKNGFEQDKDIFQFNDFIKNCNEESDKGYFLEVDI